MRPEGVEGENKGKQVKRDKKKAPQTGNVHTSNTKQ